MINGKPAAEVLKATGEGVRAIAPKGSPLSASERKAMEFAFSVGANVNKLGRGAVLTKIDDLPMAAVQIVKCYSCSMDPARP